MDKQKGPAGLLVIPDYVVPGTISVGLDGGIEFESVTLDREEAAWLVGVLSAWLNSGAG